MCGALELLVHFLRCCRDPPWGFPADSESSGSNMDEWPAEYRCAAHDMSRRTRSVAFFAVEGATDQRLGLFSQ